MLAAVPGSFYHRLFPKATMNIIMSSLTIHWLSQIPISVKDKASPAYNGGHTELHRSSLATVQSYAEQAEKDFDDFLSARADEGFVSEELRDDYNDPRYAHTLEEVNKQLEKHKSVFDIEKQEIVHWDYQMVIQDRHDADPRKMAKTVVEGTQGST
ncbi:hypothetical protein R1sor_008742 [Riccia sorocarpa]|uniref:Uncharacterized protein n=1 Tax=Riccia sorocarpa TaxID=122646 RepID=A0ABD3HWC2_9MARC